MYIEDAADLKTLMIGRAPRIRRVPQRDWTVVPRELRRSDLVRTDEFAFGVAVAAKQHLLFQHDYRHDQELSAVPDFVSDDP